jgi:acetyltransferase-like isoleucine patch superfamily enzyme
MSNTDYVSTSSAGGSRPLVAELGDEHTSAYRRYLRIFVGQPSFSAFVRYELLTGLLGSLPGAAGYFLRAKLYRYMLRRFGKGSVIGRNVTVRAPNNISIGRSVLIDDYVVLDAKGQSGSIELGDRILLGRNTILSCNESRIKMGDYVSTGPYCHFGSKSFIDIGSNVAIGSGAHLSAGSHASDDPDVAVIHQARVSIGIKVEDNVWIGSGAQILDGVTVGRNSIIGAGSVVTQDVQPYTTVLGNPARVVQKRKQGGAA